MVAARLDPTRPRKTTDSPTGKAIASGGTVLVFPGRVSQLTGRVVELLDSAPAFAKQLQACDAAFADFVDWSLLGVVRGCVGSPSIDRVDVAPSVLFAVMVSLAAQWRALGIYPDAVLGHSQGEIAAAYVAGALSLPDAARVVTLCSNAIGAVGQTGGDVDALREKLRKSLSALQPQTGEIPFISSVTGAGLDPSILDGDYWFANLRQPVLFEEAVRWSYGRGYRTFIESSPHPVLIAGIQKSLVDFAGGGPSDGRHHQPGLRDLLAQLR